MERPLVFALNGEKVEVAEPDPGMSLLTYIRTFTPYRGAKLGCGEGGCGACVVLVARYDAGSKEVEESTVNSCLAPLCSLHRCAVTTTEGLGSSRQGLHAVQARLAGFHASQCGFCTPGMTVAIAGCLKAQKGEVSAAEVERAVQGNICRCTGYRPILDACKSFGADVDLEDLGLNTFWSHKEGARADLLPVYDAARNPAFPAFLLQEGEEETREYLDCGVDLRLWVHARSLTDVFAALGKYQGRKEVKMVVGNTSQGVYKEMKPQVLIDIGSVAELLVLRQEDECVEVGSAVSISKFIRFLEEQSRRSEVAKQTAAHLRQLASVHVRNRGSVGGNLIMAQQLGFDSDLATLLLGAGASVKIASQEGGERLLSMEDFSQQGSLPAASVLLSVVVPLWKAAVAGSQVHFKSYRASPRPLGNAVSYVNCAFLAEVEQVQGRPVVKNVRLAFGAFGCKHATLAHQVQTFVVGKEVCAAVLLEAVTLLKSSLVPTKGTLKAAFRSSVMVGYLFDFFRPLLGQKAPLPTRSLANGFAAGKASKCLTRGTQKYSISDDFFPVGMPAPKVVAELQASGEAVYVDDIPSPEGCLYAAFVCSDQALAEVKSIDGVRALASPGAVSLVTAADIPKGGLNRGLNFWGIVESLFADEKVEFHGHPLGVLVADGYQHARDAAAKVDVTYDTQKLGPPLLSIEDAVAAGSYFPLPPFVPIDAIGNAHKALAESELKLENAEVCSGSQYHFYMEMQAVLVIPDEDGQLVVFSACQGTELVQQAIADCLGISMNQIRVITRRLGGGFGGKGTKSCLIATACALAAWKLRRPVRMYLDRKTDMLMVGGRSPTKTTYSVGFTKEGKITALKAKVILDAGWAPDLTVFLPMNIHSALKKYNWGCLAAEYMVTKTNLSSKTTVRGPGDVQGAFISEAVIEHVAATLGVSAQQVRDKNMHTVDTASAFWGIATAGGEEGFTLPIIWEQLKASSKLSERQRQVHVFNSNSRWCKRGIAMVPVVYKVSLSPKVGRVTAFADGSVVVEAGGIEMGQGLWTKVKQTAAYGLSQLWERKPGAAAMDLSKIRVVQADSISFGNGGVSGGSTTSESNCAGVNEACRQLVERLRPIKQKLEERNPNDVTWDAIVSAAKMSGVDLSAQTSWTPKAEQSSYVNVGAAVSEVEINVLTGETVVLQTDLLYDCGKSMNPAVDIGQVEGAFVQGVGFFLTEEILMDGKGRQLSEGTWLYKPPTMDTIPRVFNVELLNSPSHKDRILSGKASGEPPLLLAASVHCAVREAISAAKEDIIGEKPGFFRLDAPATMDKIKTHCGLDAVEQYLSTLVSQDKAQVH